MTGCLVGLEMLVTAGSSGLTFLGKATEFGYLGTWVPGYLVIPCVQTDITIPQSTDIVKGFQVVCESEYFFLLQVLPIPYM